MTLDLTAMRRAAEAANQDPWSVCDFREVSSSPSVRDISVSCDSPAYIGVCSMENGLSGTVEEATSNAAHIAAFCPANALALLDLIDAQKSEIAKVREETIGPIEKMWDEWRGKRDSWLDDDPGMSAFWRGRAEAACAILAALRKGADHV